MSRTSGALRILQYNWPIYLGTWLAAAILGLAAVTLERPWSSMALVASVIAIGWSALSLFVSHWVYDRSELSGGRWIAALFPARVGEWVSIDAGLDAEVDLASTMPGRCVARLDVFDPAQMQAGSIRRARLRTPRAHRATSSSPTALAVPDASCDAVLVAFTAHELRETRTRERFFGELRRVLRPGGRVILVEHGRDVVNFVAFGPGFLHFLPRREWLRLAALVRLRVADERRVTPWVMALALER